MNKKKQWVRILLPVLAGLLLGVQLFRWNASTLAGNQLPMPFGVGTAVIMSGSMEPTLSVDDLVIIRQADSYEVGDVVVYQSENSLVIHRIVDKQDEVVTLQGDANNAPDAPIHQRYIKGKLVAAIPNVGGAAKVLKSTPGTIVLLGLALVLMELSWRKEKAGKAEELHAIKDEIQALRQELEQEKGA